MMEREGTKLGTSLALLGGVLVALAAACGPATPDVRTGSPASTSTAPPGPAGAAGTTAPGEGPVSVLLCDGETVGTFPEGTPGTVVAGALMTEWLRKNPGTNWQANEREAHTLQPSFDNSPLVGETQGQTYGRVTEQDVAVWKAETEKLALAGSRVFHDAGELGSTVGVSCDMCHPHAANTHPETYPKFQQQLGRVVLMRDMINWCLEHPVRAKPMDADDPRMRAMEAYIYAQRRGKALEYGKH